MASTLTNLVYHIIFSTKGREPMIVAEIRDEFYRYIGGILLQIGGMPDHLHLVVKLKPSQALSTVIQKIKGNSLEWINEQKRFKSRFAWQVGYGAFSISESQIPMVVRYLKEQEIHHQKLSFKDELTLVLDRHQVDYEERHIWR